MNTSPQTPLDRAIHEAGGRTKLAKSLGFQRESIDTPGMVRVSLELKRAATPEPTPGMTLG